MKFICKNEKCSKSFTSNDKRRTYCSQSCSSIVNNTKYPKRKKKVQICATCNQPFFARRKDSRFCSSKCHRNRPSAIRFPEERNCITCGKLFSQVAHVKNCSPKCGAQYKYERWIKKWLTGETDGGTGKKHDQAKTRVKRYIKERDKYTCVLCGQKATWNNQPLSLHVDHIDGNNTNNRPENLRTLCPNCHTQTETYCSKQRNKKAEMMKLADMRALEARAARRAGSSPVPGTTEAQPVCRPIFH